MKPNEARKQEQEKDIELPYTCTKPRSSVTMKIYKGSATGS